MAYELNGHDSAAGSPQNRPVDSSGFRPVERGDT